MTSIQNINELNKLIRTELIKQSGLEGNRVRNALSEYGSDLNKHLESSVFDSISPSDSVILFELKTNPMEDDISFTDEDESLILQKTYSMNVIIYGNESGTLANIISTRFRSEKVKQDLFELGIHIKNISQPQSLNEFVNEVMWLRHDFNIDINCEMNISQVCEGEEFLSFEKIKTIKI